MASTLVALYRLPMQMTATSPLDAPDQLEKEVEAEIKEFNEWFTHAPMYNSSLMPSERALLKTFCWYMIQEKKTGK